MALLAAHDITRYFASTNVLANDGVSLSVEGGEIVAIVGENGAGKSTFARIVAGLDAQDSGFVEVHGRRLRGGSVREAERAGIGLVPQHSFLADGLEVAEAVSLGREPRRFGLFLDRRRMLAETAALAAEAGIEVDLKSKVGELVPAARRQAEILRALAWAGDILILDEPTTFLDEEDAAKLFTLLRRLAAQGKAIVFISHRAAELSAIATRIVVLRSGRLVADRGTGEYSEGELPALMSRSGSGESVSRRVAGRAEPSAPDSEEPSASGSSESAVTASSPIAEARSLVLGASHGKARIDFSVGPGECLGLVALAGNGLEELEAVLAGLAPPRAGRVVIAGRDVRHWKRRDLRRAVMGYVPADRDARGLALEASVADNLGVLGGRPADDFSPRPLLGPEGDLLRLASSLSGGNRQRLLLSRELAETRPFFLLSDPTQGLDRAGVGDLGLLLSRRKAEGSAILLLSSSIEEAVSLADRLAVLYRGGIAWQGANRGEEMIHDIASHLTGHSPKAGSEELS